MQDFKVGDKVIVHNPDIDMERYKGYKGIILSGIELTPSSYYYRCKLIDTKLLYEKTINFYCREIKRTYFKRRRLEARRLPK